MSITYSFNPYPLYNIKKRTFTNCCLVKSIDLVNRTVYFNSENDKILWLLKWSKEIDEYIKLGEKSEAIMNDMAKKFSYEMDKNIIKMFITGKTMI